MIARSRAETGAILEDLDARVSEERRRAREESEAAPRAERPAPSVPEVLTLEDALRLAHDYNRELIRDREGLIRSALALVGARNDVGPRMSGSLTSVLRGTEDAADVRADDLTLGLTDLLPTGATVGVSGTAGRAWDNGDDRDTAADGLWTASLRQPLLRGLGYESSHESLTDAERQALYDMRLHELSRQDLALRVQSEFYGLVAQKQVVENRRQSYDRFKFLKERSERLFQVDRVSEVDKFRATREFLTADNALVDAEQDYEARLDRFKVLLGIDTAVIFDVAADIPAAEPLAIELQDALEIAVHNRLDLMTARDQVDDAERRVRIRRQDLLPQVDLVANHTRNSDTERHAGSLGFDRDSFTVGVEVDLPLDRVRERGALRSAMLDLQQSRRDLAATEDRVMLDVRDSVRNYRSAVSSLAIQEQIVVSEEKNTRVAYMRFENGEISNRDVTDAQNSLTDAQDRLVNEKVNVETARVQLLRNLGVLVIDENGRWKE